MPSNWSVFDIFANIFPGALCLAVLQQLAVSAGWLGEAEILSWNTTYVFVCGLALSYFLGTLLMPLGRYLIPLFNRSHPDWKNRTAEKFKTRNPEFADRLFLRINPLLLITAVDLHSSEFGREIRRLQALGIMLRNAVVPILAGAGLALLEGLFARRFPAMIYVAVVPSLLALAFGSSRAGVRRSRMAVEKAFHAAAWLPEIDDSLRQHTTLNTTTDPD